MGRRIEATLANWPWLVCERDRQVLGYAYASRHRERSAYQWSCDVSVYVSASYRRVGIGRALYRSLFELLKLQGFRNAYAGITLPNPASVGLHESLGFKPIGVYQDVGYKLGAWHDVGWWELHLGPGVAPTPPFDLKQIRHSSSWTTALGTGFPLLRF
jgi:L-amino acid N-acyltransferase YncA